ncbi:MAG: tRNA lysidine(34) synthetase TilS [Pseudomonadota bacterium]
MAEDGAPAQDALSGEVFAALDRLAPDGPLGIAVSGGSDSLALMHLAHDWATARGRRIAVATIDHGLRGAARAEAAAVARLSHGLGIEHAVLEIAMPEQGNLQDRAREARYAALATWAQDLHLAAVATAHTRDDQAETVLMRLARGSGVGGLAAVPEQSVRAGPPPLTIIRPLLRTEREALRSYLRTRGIGWIEDPSNADPSFERVRARAVMANLAPLGIDAGGLTAAADRMREALEVLERAADRLAAEALTMGAAGQIEIACAALNEAETDTAIRLLARAAQALNAQRYPPRREALERALAYARAAVAGAVQPNAPFASGLVLSMSRSPTDRGERATMAICREPAACAAPIALPRSEQTVYWDGRLRLTGADPGLFLGALGPERLTALKHAGSLLSQGREVCQVFMAAPRAARLSAPALFRPDGALVAIFALGGWASPKGLQPPPVSAQDDLVALRLGFSRQTV